MDIICAICGEPWHTRGLNYTNSDLNEFDFYDLVNGAKCPCCAENLEGIHRLDPGFVLEPLTVEAWRETVAKASEGLFEADELAPVIEQHKELIAGGYNAIEALCCKSVEYRITFQMIGAE
ncbi:hypothetical protein [Ferrimonas balearica]|uniref:hypothetical protein n=1 Tax=Ferrimonas balearica TaxID=44012 RepID=UPI001F28E3E9|nr:hypothetical protein [Ferrimonas balearica]MBY6093816.1 hypothetical protein [Ferrimonas balearica]